MVFLFFLLSLFFCETWWRPIFVVIALMKQKNDFEIFAFKKQQHNILYFLVIEGNRNSRNFMQHIIFITSRVGWFWNPKIQNPQTHEHREQNSKEGSTIYEKNSYIMEATKTHEFHSFTFVCKWINKVDRCSQKKNCKITVSLGKNMVVLGQSRETNYSRGQL